MGSKRVSSQLRSFIAGDAHDVPCPVPGLTRTVVFVRCRMFCSAQHNRITDSAKDTKLVCQGPGASTDGNACAHVEEQHCMLHSSHTLWLLRVQLQLAVVPTRPLPPARKPCQNCLLPQRAKKKGGNCTRLLLRLSWKSGVCLPRPWGKRWAASSKLSVHFVLQAANRACSCAAAVSRLVRHFWLICNAVGRTKLT